MCHCFTRTGPTLNRTLWSTCLRCYVRDSEAVQHHEVRNGRHEKVVRSQNWDQKHWRAESARKKEKEQHRFNQAPNWHSLFSPFSSSISSPFREITYMKSLQHVYLWLLCSFSFKDLFIHLQEREHTQVVGGREREINSSRLPTKSGAQCRAGSQDSAIMIPAKTKSLTLKQPHHPGSPECFVS